LRSRANSAPLSEPSFFVALQRGDHAGDGAAITGGILEEFLDGGVEALAQKAEQLAAVLEAQPQHLGDGSDVLADGEIA